MAKSQILAIDAGGTMTDTFIIDSKGDFVVGKAQTTPLDEHIGLLNSAKDALSQWTRKWRRNFLVCLQVFIPDRDAQSPRFTSRASRWVSCE